MSWRALVPLTLAVAAWAPLASAQPAAASSPKSAADARALLAQIHDAATRRNYLGTFVVSGGGSVASAKVAHFVEGSSQFERIESLDGRQRKVYRLQRRRPHRSGRSATSR